jgi:PhnB protein
MPESVSPIPEGFHTITPHLILKGASEYIDFLKRAFGAVELSRSAGPGGRLIHASVRIGDSVLMLADHFPEYGACEIPEGDWPIRLNLYFPDADASWARALEAGCTVVFPLNDQFWGDRYGQVKDPFGYVWAIATRKENLTPEQIEQRQREFFGRHAKA